MRATLPAALVLAISLPAAAQAPVSPSSAPEEVRFRNGDLRLAGLWWVPEGRGPFPAAVFIRGSGPSTRGGAWTTAVRDVLLEAGVAVLVPDKRGSDGSGGDWRTADFDDLAGDALAAVDFVRARPEVRADAVGLVGLSQGGKIAPVAAAGSDRVAWVIDLVGAATPLAEQVSWEMYHTFREAGLEGEALQQALGVQVAAERYLEGATGWERYAAAREEALTSPWASANPDARAVIEGFPEAEDAWRWDFFRRVVGFDPLPHWREVRQPVLVVYGEDDPNAPTVRSAYRLTRAFEEEGHPDWTVRVLPRTGHALWDPESDPHRPELHPGLVELLRSWLGRVAGP